MIDEIVNGYEAIEKYQAALRERQAWRESVYTPERAESLAADVDEYQRAAYAHLVEKVGSAELVTFIRSVASTLDSFGQSNDHSNLKVFFSQMLDDQEMVETYQNIKNKALA
jgi:3'-phosphoadenosine 5'-phosphosulfate sulfotransferase